MIIIIITTIIIIIIIIIISWKLIPRLTFPDLNWKFLFSFFLQKIKRLSFVSLVLRLIWIWRIQWWWLFFLFLTRSIIFWQICSKKNKFVWWGWTLEPRLIWICIIRWWFSFFFFLDQKYPFWDNLLQRFNIFSLNSSLVDYFEYVKSDVDVHVFSLDRFLQIFPKKSIRHFYVTWLISR